MRLSFQVAFGASIIVMLLPAIAAGEGLHMLYMAQAGYQPSDILERARSFEAETGTPVELSFVEYEEQYRLILASSEESVSDYDIILLDLIWTAEFAEQGIIRPLSDKLESEVVDGIAPEIYSAFEYEQSLWAMPFLGNFQLMYTNTDLLEAAGHRRIPETLEEVKEVARDAKDRGVIEYPLFLPLREQEALVCVFVWLTGAHGGNLVDEHGEIAVNTPEAVQAVAYLQTLLEEDLLNPYSLEREEVFAADVFLAGDSMITMNWTFLGGLVDDADEATRQRSVASTMPALEESRSQQFDANDSAQSTNTETSETVGSTVSGYQGLAVPANSENPDRAWEFVRYLASPEFQRSHPNEMPVWRDAWDDSSNERSLIDRDLKQRQIAGATHRPIHPEYREISDRLQHWIHRALSENLDAALALDNAQSEIEGIVE